MRYYRIPILTQAFADKQGYYQSGYPGTDMNYRTSSKIQGSRLAANLLPIPSGLPDHKPEWSTRERRV